MKLLGVISGVLSKELEKDDRGHTNILLLGVGGEAHEGKDLTDTIMVASLDHAEKSIGLLSLPRDFYVETMLGGTRVNRLYEKGKLTWNSLRGLEFAREEIADILDKKIHYVVKVDFEAFEQIVDAVSGIDVNVEEEINDPLYPRDGTFDYEPFYLPKGLQHLDGETALKYARSRKSTSDFDRSKRQQQVLLALKEKGAEEHIFRRQSFLRELYESLEEHVETDMSFREMLAVVQFGAEWDSKNLKTATLNDEPIFRGGLLYVPLRELYGGAYVLLPAGDSLDSVRFFAELILYGPPDTEQFSLAILNGTGASGLAAKTKGILHRFGVNVSALGNARADSLEETIWYIKSADANASALTDFLIKLIPGSKAQTIPQEYMTDPKFLETALILELGKSSVPVIEKLDIFKNVVQLVPTGTSTLQGTSTSQ